MMKPYNPQNFILIEGCKNGNLQDVISAISNGADVNTVDICGHTPLEYSLRNNNQCIIDYLKANGASI